MTTKITAPIKGLITGILMVASGLILHFTKTPLNSPLQYSAYFLFSAGIVWTILSYTKTKNDDAKFGELFNQGFKCFVVATLAMALFTLVFYKSNPKIIEERSNLAKQEILKTDKNRTPQEIDEMIANGKKYFIPMAMSVVVFQYLLIGSIVSAATAVAVSLSKKN
jgi:hypothetical protein